jgi:hypothetical protein
VGPTCQLGVERWGCFPAMEVETGWGTGVARRPTRPGEDGGSSRKIGPARRAGLIPYERRKKFKRVLIFEFK